MCLPDARHLDTVEPMFLEVGEREVHCAPEALGTLSPVSVLVGIRNSYWGH